MESEVYSEQHPGELHGHRVLKGPGGKMYSTLSTYFYGNKPFGTVDLKMKHVIYFKGKIVQQTICSKPK